MKTYAALICIFLLAGCASVSGYEGLSAEQLTALSKLKDVNVNCIKGSTIWTGPFFSVFVNVDKGVVPEGGVTVSPDCAVTFTNTRVVTTVTTTTTPIAPAVVPK
jgi:hypothetical protein